MSKKSCVIYDSWGEIIKNLPNEMAGELIKMILEYAFNDGSVQCENPAINAIFAMVKAKLDEDAEKYQEKVDRLKNNSTRSRNDIDTKSERNRDEVGGVSDTVSVSVSDNKDIKEQKKRFVKPSLEEVRSYCQERSNNVNPEAFIDFYESKGWKVGNQPMKDWKAAVRTWEKRETNKSSPSQDIPQTTFNKIHNFSERNVDYASLEAEFL